MLATNLSHKIEICKKRRKVPVNLKSARKTPGCYTGRKTKFARNNFWKIARKKFVVARNDFAKNVPVKAKSAREDFKKKKFYGEKI